MVVSQESRFQICTYTVFQYLRDMGSDDQLMQSIASRRKVSDDGSLVTYDLTSGVDFSNPKKAAKALADVFFESDAKNWFKVTDDHVDFEPTYKVRVVLAEEHNKLLESTVDDFLTDLKKDELTKDFSPEIRDDAHKASRLGTIIAVGSVTSALFRHTENKVYANSIKDDLFIDLLEKLEIRSLNNRDLMDWKNLPL